MAETRVRPILFSAPMVRAILDGRKTQTRRVVRWKLREEGLNLAFSGLEAGCYSCDDQRSGFVLRSRGAGSCWNDRTWPAHSPYGLTGDRLWVRETWWRGAWTEEHFYNDHDGASCSSVTWCRPAPGDLENIAYVADGEPPADRCEHWDKVPSIFMPRWASRITLEVTEVRVQRLQEISEDDARAEGCSGIPDVVDVTPREEFERLWNSINGKPRPMLDDDGEPVLDDNDRRIMEASRSWSGNPWVWALTFRRVQP